MPDTKRSGPLMAVLCRVVGALALALSLSAGDAVRAQQQAESVPRDVQLLGPQQTVDIRIGRWDAVAEAFVPWETIGGAYKISATGTIALPFVGSVQASGLAPDELGRALAQRFQDRLGLSSDIQAVVTISEFAPIYMLGDVRAPGAYPHVPGMTVLQALSLAGGLEQPATALLRGERNALGAMGNYRVFELERMRRLARLARLEAEETGSQIVVPPDLAASPLAAELIEQERRIMVAQKSAFESSMAQIEELEALLQERITRLEQQAGLRQRQLALLNEELENAASLVERGLSTVARESNLQRAVTDQQVRLLEVETARLTAQQQLNETRRDRLDLTNERDRERVQGVQDQRAAIAELSVRMETEAALFAESTQIGNGLVALSEAMIPVLQITRTGPQGTETFAVNRDDPVQGGDVVEVVLSRPAPGDAIPVHRLAPDGAALPAPDANAAQASRPVQD